MKVAIPVAAWLLLVALGWALLRWKDRHEERRRKLIAANSRIVTMTKLPSYRRHCVYVYDGRDGAAVGLVTWRDATTGARLARPEELWLEDQRERLDLKEEMGTR